MSHEAIVAASVPAACACASVGEAMDAMDRATASGYVEQDHDEALVIARQMGMAGFGVTAQHVIDLNRFCECAEDDEGYDVPRERMRALRGAGLVAGGRGGYYTTTEAGERLRAAWFK